jgi:hypothetical protein
MIGRTTGTTGSSRRPAGLAGGFRLPTVALICLLLAGCEIAALGKQPPTQVYVLSTLEDQGRPPAPATTATTPSPRAGATTTAGLERSGSIGVSTLSFPPYLERKEIVTRASDNRLVVQQFHKWGSAPDEEFSRALAANLRVLSPGRQVVQPPFRSGILPESEIRVSVDRFERLADGTVVLDARWVVLGQPEGRPLASPSAQIRIPGVAADIPAVVDAMSAAVIALAEQMAGDLALLPGRRMPPAS